MPVLQLIAIRMVSEKPRPSLHSPLWNVVSSDPLSWTAEFPCQQSITLIGCITWLHRINDPNPFFGPPQVRKMLALRGFIG
jgi:hypothetical protein